MSPARRGPRRPIPTEAILQAVATRGRRWTAAFRHEEVVAVNEAVERELMAGNLSDPQTLSAQGERALVAYLGHPNEFGRLDQYEDHRCRRHESCWTIRCARCDTVQVEHVPELDLEDHVQKLVDSHTCKGSVVGR